MNLRADTALIHDLLAASLVFDGVPLVNGVGQTHRHVAEGPEVGEPLDRRAQRGCAEIFRVDYWKLRLVRIERPTGDGLVDARWCQRVIPGLPHDV